MAEFPTISSDPSQPPSELPEEDIGGGYTSALGFSAENVPADLGRMTGPAMPMEVVAQREYDRSVPAPSDEEAAQLYERLPFFSDEERAVTLARLDRYAAELENKEAKARNDQRKREFLDPKARIEWLGQDEVKNNLGYLDDANAAYDRMAVRDALEKDILKRPLSESEYESARNEFIGRRLGGKAKVSDQEAFGLLAKQVEKAKDSEDTLAAIKPEIVRGVIEANLAKKPFSLGDAWDKARKGIPDLTPEQEDELYVLTARQAEDIKARIGRNGPVVSSVFGYFQKLGAGTATMEDEKAVFDELRRVPQADLEEALLTAAAAVRTGEIDPGIFKKAITKFRNEALGLYGIVPAAKGMSNTAADMQIADRRRALEAGEIRMTPEGEPIWTLEPGKQEVGVPLSKEKKAELSGQLDELEQLNQIDRTVRNVFETKVKNVDIFSPTTAYGIPATIERMFFGAKQQVGPMVLMALSPVAYVSVVGSQSYEAIMLANPKMDKGMAGKMAAAETVVNFVGDSLQLGRAKSFIQGLFKDIPAGRKLARAAWTYGIETVTEIGQDYFSDVSKRILQDTMRQIDPNIDVGTIKKWEDMMSWAQVGETAGQMFFLAGIGVGVLTYRDIMDPSRAVYNDDMLRREGIPQDKINMILAEEDFGVRDQLLQATIATLTPEQKNNGILYSQEQDAKARENIATGGMKAEEPDAFVPPRLVAADMVDGTRRFNLLDANGTVVREGMTEGVANAEYNDLVRTSFGEYIQKQVEARQTEEAEAKGVAAETKWNILSAREKTTLGNILEYEYGKPTPEQQKSTEGLKRLLAQRQQPVPDLVAVSVEQPTTRAGKLALNFVRWFEDTFKKQVVFVASASGESLPFDGAVNSSDPNTIFLNAAGNGNVLSLLGHEWSHTLEKTNPKLWKDIMERMQPMITDWAVQVGKIGEGYKPEERTSEFVANVLGDAFGDPEFWKMVREKDANLFQRMLQAVQEWFDTVIEHASEWGTQEFVKDLKGLRELVSEAMKTAEAGPEAEAGTAAGVQTAAQRHKVQLASRRIEKGFYSKLEDFVSGPKVQKTSSPEQVKATINGAGIKAEEIKWSGVMPKIDEIAAENQGKVPKEKLVTHLEDEGSVEFKEVTLREGGEPPAEFIRRYDEITRLRDYGGQISALQAYARIEALRLEFDLDEHNKPLEGRPRYEAYVLPGGENYREVVLAMPSKGSEVYRSSHFPNVPNYVAHMRLNEREGGLFIEEIQSDRHQQGREKGYKEDVSYTEEDLAKEGLTLEFEKAGQRYVIRDEFGNAFGTGGTRSAAIADLAKTRATTRIPDAPFRKDWPIAMFKRALRDAVATGKEWIGWTVAKTQEDRYWGHELVAPAVENWNEVTKPESVAELSEQFLGRELASELELSGVEASMLPLMAKHEQIRKFVVQSVPVNVVDTLAPHGLSADQVVSDPSMVWKALPVDDRATVTRGFRLALMDSVTRLRASLYSVLTTGRDGEFLPTLKASVLTSREIVRLLSPISAANFVGDKGRIETVAARAAAKEGAELGGDIPAAELANLLTQHSKTIEGRPGESNQNFQPPPGQGMKGFYDKMLPNEIGKYVKQWGGKVEQGQVSVPPKTRYFYERQLPSGEWHRAGALGGEDNLEWIQERVEQMNAQGRNEWRVAEDKGEPVPIWKVEITPQMKAGVNEGQVQFALPREEAPRRKLHVPGETVPVTAFDKDAGTFVPTPMKPTKELLKILRVEQRTYNELLKCLAA